MTIDPTARAPEALSRGDWIVEQPEQVAAEIARGFEQAEQGELVDGDIALEALRQCWAERLRPQRPLPDGSSSVRSDF